MRQVDTGLLSQSGLIGVEGDFVDARAVANVIEKDVARLLNALVQGDGAVPWLPPTLVITPIKRRAARAMHRELIINGAGFATVRRATEGPFNMVLEARV